MANSAGPTDAVPAEAAAVRPEPGSAAAAGPRDQRLFLIDGYSNIFRAFYAIRNLSNSKGEPTNAIYGFVTMLRKLLREEQPELIGVALETGKTFRTERFEAYKANRAPMPEDLASQMPWIRRVLEAFRIPILELAGYEADDVLGTLSCRAAEAGYHVVLVSADKDLMQLVEPRVSLYHTGRTKLYGPSDVAEDFGVPPAKVADVLALMGDSIDNIPGVPGIGDKGAKALIQEFGSLEELLARAGEVTRKSYREGLQQHAEQARLSKELSTIHTSLPIPFDPTALRRDPPDTAALRRLYGELEFFSLVEELAPEPAAQILLGGGTGAGEAGGISGMGGNSGAGGLGEAGGSGTSGELGGAAYAGGPAAQLPLAREALSPADWETASADILRAAAREGEAAEVFVAVLGEAPPLGLALAERNARAGTVVVLRGRGTVYANLTVERKGIAPTVKVNEQVLAAVLAALKGLSGKVEAAPPSLDGILALKGVIEVAEEDEREEDRRAAEAAIIAGFDKLLADLVAMRREEGATLGRLLSARLDEIAKLAARAEAAPGRKADAIKARLTEQVATLLAASQRFDSDRLHQEAILLAAKADIREELDRLASHVAQVRKLIADGGPIGRRLDFLAQELNRESNTLTAKANDVDLTNIGLELKSVVEQFREQVQNLE